MDTKERIYLDYNATAPLAKSFVAALHADKVPYANPSSQHTSGKQSHKYIEQVKSYLFNYFGLSESSYNILFHSGATEASNTFLKDQKFLFFKSDHACVTSMASDDNSVSLDIKSDGSIDIDTVTQKIKKEGCSWLHYTYVHNETGIKWPLEHAQKIKKETNCLVYVDAVQSVGKIEGYQKLIDGPDVYTFSGHKFGALKGVGFSFYKKSLDLTPLIHGGGQQDDLRSGTMNLHGIASLKYALESTELKDELMSLKTQILELLSENKDINVIQNESYNTICFVHTKLKSDVMLIYFDLAGLDVSSGSACSAGSVIESATLRSMGYGDLARNNIRISLGVENISQKDAIIQKLKQVLEKL